MDAAIKAGYYHRREKCPVLERDQKCSLHFRAAYQVLMGDTEPERDRELHMEALAKEIHAEKGCRDWAEMLYPAMEHYGEDIFEDPLAEAFELALKAHPDRTIPQWHAMIIWAAAKTLSSSQGAKGFMLPQVRIAELLGVSQPTVSHIIGFLSRRRSGAKRRLVQLEPGSKHEAKAAVYTIETN